MTNSPSPGLDLRGHSTARPRSGLGSTPSLPRLMSPNPDGGPLRPAHSRRAGAAPPLHYIGRPQYRRPDCQRPSAAFSTRRTRSALRTGQATPAPKPNTSPRPLAARRAAARPRRSGRSRLLAPRCRPHRSAYARPADARPRARPTPPRASRALRSGDAWPATGERNDGSIWHGGAFRLPPALLTESRRSRLPPPSGRLYSARRQASTPLPAGTVRRRYRPRLSINARARQGTASSAH